VLLRKGKVWSVLGIIDVVDKLIGQYTQARKSVEISPNLPVEKPSRIGAATISVYSTSR
jgi:hypothetical protein